MSNNFFVYKNHKKISAYFSWNYWENRTWSKNNINNKKIKNKKVFLKTESIIGESAPSFLNYYTFS